MADGTKLHVETPEIFLPLWSPARYKGIHGGRGSSKSHTFAEVLTCKAYDRPLRWACIREVQNTLKESVKQLLVDKIAKFGLGWFYEVLDSEIRGRNGSLIIFRGMQAYNAESIKSLEGFDGAWVEEAQTLSAISLRMLRPTIRKDGSELWFSWNPRHDTDPVDAFFRGANRPKNAVVIEANWHDNPWFPAVLLDEKDRDYEDDPDMAAHVWGGGYQIISEGSYYAKLIAQAEKEGRVGHFPHDPSLPVITSFDLGVDDYTAIWFWQERGGVAYAIDYYEVSGDGADRIIATALPEVFTPPPWQEEWIGWKPEAALADLDRAVPFKYGHHFMPHDIRMREWGAGARSRIETVKSLGLSNVMKGSATNPEDRIAAVRALLPLTRFNSTPRVMLGLKRLRSYRRRRNDALATYTSPVHDEASHCADAFGEFAVNSRVTPRPETAATARQKEEVLTMTARGVESSFSLADAIEAQIRAAAAKRLEDIV